MNDKSRKTNQDKKRQIKKKMYTGTVKNKHDQKMILATISVQESGLGLSSSSQSSDPFRHEMEIDSFTIPAGGLQRNSM